VPFDSFIHCSGRPFPNVKSQRGAGAKIFLLENKNFETAAHPPFYKRINIVCSVDFSHFFELPFLFYPTLHSCFTAVNFVFH